MCVHCDWGCAIDDCGLHASVCLAHYEALEAEVECLRKLCGRMLPDATREPGLVIERREALAAKETPPMKLPLESNTAPLNTYRIEAFVSGEWHRQFRTCTEPMQPYTDADWNNCVRVSSVPIRLVDASGLVVREWHPASPS